MSPRTYVPREIGVHHGSNLNTTLKLGEKGRKEGKESARKTKMAAGMVKLQHQKWRGMGGKLDRGKVLTGTRDTAGLSLSRGSVGLKLFLSIQWLSCAEGGNKQANEESHATQATFAGRTCTPVLHIRAHPRCLNYLIRESGVLACSMVQF